MLKVLIADDEEIIREGLKKVIDWTMYDFEICGDAVNGKDALNKIRELKPNLVITDIKMPGMDGLELFEALKNENIPCKKIILTGYSDFEYAKKSIDLGVSAFLLKPVDSEDLIKKIKKLRNEINEEITLTKILNFDHHADQPEQCINEIKAYVIKHYYEKLTLRFLADKFGYNPDYLGKLFKSSTGEYFTDFLDFIRIEMSVKLLKKGMKVYEIAELVGYGDVNYFYRKFMKYKKVSPSKISF